MANNLLTIYSRLLTAYGPQGWWPIEGIGYHHSDYSFPRTKAQKFEIAVGAILTQNTAWNNAQQAMKNLRDKKMLVPGSFVNSRKDRIARLIRPSGYFNMKAVKLKCLDRAWQEGKWHLPGRQPTREALLSVWGIGNETADSILLYAFHEPVFVVDAYTRRIFSCFGIIKKKTTYEKIQDIFHENLVRDELLFNEYHALLVRHAKEHCRKKPVCADCPLSGIAVENGSSDFIF